MTADLVHSRRGNALIIAAIAIVFLALRIALLAARDPFFDELFTLWISSKPFAGIIDALRHDSGPPLYYFVVHALGVKTALGARVISLVAASAAMAVLLFARSLGTARFTAAALLAVYPPAVLSAIDARAYALCALLVTIGLVALHGGRVFAAAMAFVFAAYCHYYGALLFPLLLIPFRTGGSERDLCNASVGACSSAPAAPVGGGPTRVADALLRVPTGSSPLHRPLAVRRLGMTVFSPNATRRILATIVAAVLFAPALYLASQQPRQSMQWLRESRWSWLRNLSFAGDYAYGLFQPAPMWLVGVAVLLLLAAVAGPAWNRRARLRHAEPPRVRGWLAAAATIVPLLIAVAAGVYFPMRFESIIAVPLTLWISFAVESWTPPVRRTIVAALLGIGLATTYAGILDHARRPLDGYRDAALWTEGHVPRGERLVASGYCYLEAVMNGNPGVIAFPPEQGVHPGWRAVPQRDTPLPPAPFVWIGERASPELSILRRSRAVQPLYGNGSALVARVR
jgi:hypothetical protein